MAEKQSSEKQIEWVRSERLVDGFFEVDRITVRHEQKDGTMSPELQWMLLRRPDAVCAVVVNTERHLIYFVKQFRLGIAAKHDDAWAIELAAGVVDREESLEEAIRREVREELGFEAKQIRQVQKIYPSPAILSERIFLYYVEVTDADRVHDGGGTLDEHEDLEVIRVPLADLGDFLEKHEITDGKTLIGLAWYMATKGRP